MRLSLLAIEFDSCFKYPHVQQLFLSIDFVYWLSVS